VQILLNSTQSQNNVVIYYVKLTSHTMKIKMKLATNFFTNIILLQLHWLRLKFDSSATLNDLISWQNSTFLLTYSQFLASLLIIAIFVGFLSLYTILVAVACAQFQKMNAAILDIRQQNTTSHHIQQNEQVHATEYSNMQAKLNACVRHHHKIME